MPAAEVARGANLSERQIKRLRNRYGVPTPRTCARLLRLAAAYARAQLGPAADDITACSAFPESCQAASSADDPTQTAKAPAALAEPKSAQPSVEAEDNPVPGRVTTPVRGGGTSAPPYLLTLELF